MAAARPAGTVTFLCTAVVDAATADWHDSIGGDTIARRGGYVFATSDDGLAAAFPTAVDAAGAAGELQQHLLTDRDGRGFDVGVGLHTGEASDGAGDYAGPEADRAVRLTSIAHGGQ